MGMVISISPVGILILGRNEKCLHCKQVYINNEMNHIVDILMSVDFISHQFMDYTQYAMVS